jgi:hypothetical protein
VGRVPLPAELRDLDDPEQAMHSSSIRVPGTNRKSSIATEP